MGTRITVISSMATRRALADLAGLYRQQTRREVDVKSMGGVDAARLVRSGAPVDVVILAAEAMKGLEQDGHLLPQSRLGFARSGIAAAVPVDATRPNLGNAEAVRQTMLDARSICYSTGPSGDHLLTLWKQWGIFELLSARLVLAPPGISVASILARRDADLGFQQLSELLDQPGIDIVGPLPTEIQAVTIFSAGIGRSSSSAAEASSLIAYLNSRDAEAVKRRYGLDAA